MFQLMGYSLSWSLEDIYTPLREIPIVFLQIIQYFCNWSSPAAPNKHTATDNKVHGPLLAFSYAGMLWSYYLGAVAFFRDHFDLHQSKVSLSGISAGCASVMVIFLDLSIEQGFEFGLEWNKLFNSRFLKFFALSTSCASVMVIFLDLSIEQGFEFGLEWNKLFNSRFLKFFALSTSQTLRMIVNKFEQFGITDQVLAAQYAKYGGANAIHFGVTAFQFTRLRIFHLILNNFTSLKQTVYAALCSMRIVPFFRSFGFYNGYYCCDGAVTSNYSIPTIYRTPANKDKVIRIGVLSDKLVKSDIAPNQNFHLNEFIISGDMDANLVRFNKGYRDAAAFANVVDNYIRKGLIWSHSQIDPQQFEDAGFERQWNTHIDERVNEWNMRIKKHINDCQEKEC
eukprot:CAMPEP_0197074462 /NCGR_PEP_ID=MMETSP1384-20130603/211118_1 /TAXON_ID=29189 /ORGANISM="Ammonia sp." /LENGTH=395 /DNA_ID=CAMNT_0042513303 /DNA_START=51 /DNA_END=1238 /DNA_ORIENTATION=-